MSIQSEPNNVSSHNPSLLVAQEIQESLSPSNMMLTEREIEVLRLIAQGLTNNQIAQQLRISSHTVNAHVKTIYSKLGITNRSGATSYAIKQRLI